MLIFVIPPNRNETTNEKNDGSKNTTKHYYIHLLFLQKKEMQTGD